MYQLDIAEDVSIIVLNSKCMFYPDIGNIGMLPFSKVY